MCSTNIHSQAQLKTEYQHFLIELENFIDEKLRLENMLGANTISLTILVDANGRVVEKVRGARGWDSPKIIDAIEECLASS